MKNFNNEIKNNNEYKSKIDVNKYDNIIKNARMTIENYKNYKNIKCCG